MKLDHESCYQAVLARDARYDGLFFICVKTTGVYCRPICPARHPRPENCVFVSSAAAAQEAGFRPCLRCRPESSPDLGAWRGASATVSRAMALIEDGALDGGDVEALANRLGIGERQLRRLFRLHIGANGVGKSLLVRTLRRAVEGEATPGITVSPSVVMGYVDQLMSQLPSKETLLGFVTGQFRLGDRRSVSLLAGAGFDFDAQLRSIALLSPGQKARLGLLALRLAEPNFYLMDEPTNHVDIAGQERLEAEILAHEATCVLVSHDRFFVRAIGTRFFHIEGGAMREMDA